MYQTFINNI